MNILDTLNDMLADVADDWSDEDRELAKEVAHDLGALLSREVAGGSASDEELAIARATARNIAAGATLTGVTAINRALQRFISGVASKLLL